MRDLLAKIGFGLCGAPERILKGGSARAFFRFCDASRGPCVFCEYSAEKEENFLYAPIAEFLGSCGLSVPKVYYHDPDARVLVMEDLGSRDLLDFSKNAAPPDLEAAYAGSLAEAARLHGEVSGRFELSPVRLMPGFDDGLYLWEQGYFYENLAAGLFGLGVGRPEEEWSGLRLRLLAAPRSLLHRDFQSQNVIMRGGGGVGLIDFQGMRVGPCWYDVASLLFDPYADIPSGLRESLYARYCALRGLDAAANRGLFLAAAAERLMQALGAFAFLAQKKGRREYLAHIPAALRLLGECARLSGLEKTAEIAGLCEKCLAGDPRFCEIAENEQ